MSLRSKIAGFFGALVGLAAAQCASAGPFDAPGASPAAPKTVNVDIVADLTAGTPRSEYKVGIRLRHEPGWHTYWRFTGDTGYPISVDWKLPRNWSVTPEGWPLPEKKKVGHLTNFIYSGEVLLPFKLDIPWGTPYNTYGKISAKVEYLACKDICIPGEAEVRFSVPVKVSGTPSKHAELFEKTRTLTPEPVPAGSISATMQGDNIRIDFPADAGRINSTVDFYPLANGLLTFKGETHLQKNDDGTTSLYVKAHRKFVEAPAASMQGVIVADNGPANGGWAIETSVPVKQGTVTLPVAPVKAEPIPAKRIKAEVPASVPAQDLTVWMAFAFAFAGGLILNLMPCVFPVLSLKVLQLVDGSRRKGSLAAHGFAFTAGVMASMLALAGIMIALRSFGWAIGWGFQLQTPWVVGVLILLFFAIALNLFGLFEFTAASHLADSRAARALPTTGPAGSFSTGILAVVVASPCTAPFMGAALGYAVMQSTLESILVFAGLGLGMALPWLILTLVPFWTKWLPRPGAWMETFKRIMAIPMIGAAVWLVWVLYRQVTVYGLITIMFATASFAALLWAIGREQYGRGNSRTVKIIGAAITVACVGVLACGTFDKPAEQTGTSVQADARWQDWSPKAVEDAINDGHPVVVDFTAAWCVTCQFNKAAALRTDAADAELDKLGYRCLSADWTNRDEEITKALNAFGRTGVPLYLLYSTEGKVTVLPELLTESDFIAAIQKNAAKK